MTGDQHAQHLPRWLIGSHNTDHRTGTMWWCRVPGGFGLDVTRERAIRYASYAHAQERAAALQASDAISNYVIEQDRHDR